MPKYHFDIEQGTEAWDMIRLGKPTASEFGKILTAGGKDGKTAKPSDQWLGYACRLIAERVLDRKIDTYATEPMKRGVIVEAEAVDWYQWETGGETSKIGFVTDDAGEIGCSPDRLVGDKGLLQVKCPLPQTQVEYFLTGKLHQTYRPQLQGELYVTGRDWVDVLSWHAELPRIVIRVERDEGYIAKLEKELIQFNTYIKGVMEKIVQAQRPKAASEPKAPLRAMLQATLAREIVP